MLQRRTKRASRGLATAARPDGHRRHSDRPDHSTVATSDSGAEIDHVDVQQLRDRPMNLRLSICGTLQRLPTRLPRCAMLASPSPWRRPTLKTFCLHRFQRSVRRQTWRRLPTRRCTARCASGPVSIRHRPRPRNAPNHSCRRRFHASRTQPQWPDSPVVWPPWWCQMLRRHPSKPMNLATQTDQCHARDHRC